jgi:hypothetical protein
MTKQQPKSRGRGRPRTRDGMVRVEVAVPPDERAGLREVARAADMTLTQWCRSILNTAVVRAREAQS